MHTHTAFIGIGANLGDAMQTMQQALDQLSQHPQISNVCVSPFYHSAPVESTGPTYTNACARLQTSLDAYSLLHLLQSLENQYGRTRPYLNAPRTLDLDLLLFDNLQINDPENPELILPHPRLHLRAFVLLPLQDLGLTRVPAGPINQLLEAITDQPIERIT